MLELRLKRSNKTYRENEVISGTLIINHPQGDFSHSGVSLTLQGIINLQLSSKNVGRFEAFYNTAKPRPILDLTVELVKPGRLPTGVTEIPFQVPLKGSSSSSSPSLYETYHGVFVNITYTLRADMKRNFVKKDASTSMEFMVEGPEVEGAKASPVDFTITPETLMKGGRNMKSSLPDLKITGRLDSRDCSVNRPLTGEINVLHCDAPIKSIELQLVRVETCGCAEGFAREATEIQNIQVGEGDVCRDFPIPLFMVFPRLFTCPTLITDFFKVEFEVNVAVIFADDHLVTKNFPLNLFRSRPEESTSTLNF